jgi:hypothetical protein
MFTDTRQGTGAAPPGPGAHLADTIWRCGAVVL